MGKAVSTPTEPATDAGELAARARAAAEPTVPEVRWEKLIDFQETDRSMEAATAAAPVRRLPWPSRPVAIAASFFGLIALGVIIITIKGRNGDTKITASDDSSFKVETPEVIVEHNLRG